MIAGVFIFNEGDLQAGDVGEGADYLLLLSRGMHEISVVSCK